MIASTTWYVARASGWVAWLLLVVSVGWGLLSVIRLSRRPGRARRWNVIHRTVGWWTAVLVGLHLAMIAADDVVEFTLVEMTVPLASDWRPAAVAWGVIALWGVVIVLVTSVLRHRLPRPVWRATHLLSIVALAAASIHAVTAGTDARALVPRLLTVGGLSWVAFAIIGRVTALGRRPRRTLTDDDSSPASRPDLPGVADVVLHR